MPHVIDLPRGIVFACLMAGLFSCGNSAPIPALSGLEIMAGATGQCQYIVLNESMRRDLGSDLIDHAKRERPRLRTVRLEVQTLDVFARGRVRSLLH